MITAIGCSQWSLISAISQKKNDSNLQWLSKGFSQTRIWSRNSRFKPSDSSPLPSHGGAHKLKKTDIHLVTRDISSPSLTPELLDAWNDDYNGVVIDPECLPMSANAFASALRASLSHWELKGKKGVWLKILQEQAELVPIAIQEGFNYHHAESGYVMLTYWIPDDLCMLPGSPSHQIGVGAFVINDKREVLVVKEKCPCSCSGVWKFPTGYINKSEDIFSGAIREVKEETGIDTVFLEIVAFRHAHLMAFEHSDLLFVCMLKPLSYEIIVDEKEIQDAKWMPLEEFIEQPFYKDDPMSKKVINICIAAHEDRYYGYVGQEMTSKLDRKLSYLYHAGTTKNLELLSIN